VAWVDQSEEDLQLWVIHQWHNLQTLKECIELKLLQSVVEELWVLGEWDAQIAANKEKEEQLHQLV
jgi:hypothetical protein